jgi:bacterial/archaeal transporter family protein
LLGFVGLGDNHEMRQETRLVPSWLLWALGSAGFAALTAIFAKVGVEKVAPDVATLVRTVVILAMLSVIVVATGQYRLIAGTSSRAYGFLLLSGLATGASWFCYFRALHLGDAARVAPIDKLSVVLVASFSVLFLGEKLSVTNWLGVALIAAGAWLVTSRF